MQIKEMHAFETGPNERNALFLALNVPIIVTDTLGNSSKLHLYTISPNEKESRGHTPGLSCTRQEYYSSI